MPIHGGMETDLDPSLINRASGESRSPTHLGRKRDFISLSPNKKGSRVLAQDLFVMWSQADLQCQPSLVGHDPPPSASHLRVRIH